MAPRTRSRNAAMREQASERAYERTNEQRHRERERESESARAKAGAHVLVLVSVSMCVCLCAELCCYVQWLQPGKRRSMGAPVLWSCHIGRSFRFWERRLGSNTLLICWRVEGGNLVSSVRDGYSIFYSRARGKNQKMQIRQMAGDDVRLFESFSWFLFVFRIVWGCWKM